MVLALTLTGCTLLGEANWNVIRQLPTNIDPKIGSYSSDLKGTNHEDFSVIEKDGKISTDSNRYDDIPVIAGTFYNVWGEIRSSESITGNFPTDSYAISGAFMSPTEAHGQIEYAYNGRITSFNHFMVKLVENKLDSP